MTPLRYHRQLARSIYIWGLFTPADFGLLIGALAANIAIFDSNLAMLAILGGYPAYLAAFRLGRPPGHDTHFFQAWFLQRHFRPGRESRPHPLRA